MRSSNRCFRRWMSAVLGACVILTSICSSLPDVYAEETETVITMEVSLDDEICTEEACETLDVSAAASVYDAVRSTFASSYLTSSNDTVIYQLLKQKIEAVAAGEETQTTFTVSMSDLGLQDTYTLEELGVEGDLYDYDAGAWNTAVVAEAADALALLVERDLTLIHSALLGDLPYELYWYDKTEGITYTGFKISYSSNNVLTVTQDSTYSFAVSEDYQDADADAPETTVDADRVAEALEAAAYAAEIVSTYASYDDAEKLEAYMEVICDLTSYNDEAADDDTTAYGDPWQLIYVFDQDSTTEVVCEGYSKAFQYLCDLSDFEDDITCYSVNGYLSAGTGTGAHMWNIVTTSDGIYQVDVTNCDSGYSSVLFMSLGSGSVSAGYTFTYNTQEIGYTYADTILALYDESVLLLHDHTYETDDEAVVCSLCGYEMETAEEDDGSDSNSEDSSTDTSGDDDSSDTEEDSSAEESGDDDTGADDDNSTEGSGDDDTSDADEDSIAEESEDDSDETGEDSTGTEDSSADDADDESDTEEDALIDLTGAVISLESDSYTYTGEEIEPDFTVSVDGEDLQQDVDYTALYTDNVDAGTGTITITGIGSYTGTVEMTFTINAQELVSSRVSLSYTSKAYTGSALKPTVTVKDAASSKLTKNTDYTLAYSNNTDVGTATVKVTGKGNYTGTVTKTYTITQQGLKSANTSLKTTTYTYSGSAKKPTVIVYNTAGVKLTQDEDYTVKYLNNTAIGKATVKITGIGNYKGTITKTFKINPGKVTLSSVKSSAAGKLTVKWKKLSGSVKYQIRYKKSGGSWTYKCVTASTVSKTFSNLTALKNYTVQVRAFKTVDKVTYYGSWSSSASATVKKAQTLTITKATKTVSYASVKKAKQTVKAITKVSGAKGTIKYTKSSGASYFTVNSSTGKITVKKGTPKGTYKVKIKVTAAAKGNYTAASKTVTVTIKVK